MMKVGMVEMVANKGTKNSYVVGRWPVPSFSLTMVVIDDRPVN